MFLKDPQAIVCHPPNDQWSHVKVKQSQIEGTKNGPKRPHTISGGGQAQLANKCPMNQISGQTNSRKRKTTRKKYKLHDKLMAKTIAGPLHSSR